ncbi:MAG: DUF6516 family protein [Candidatus Aminicenantes bacterium]|jgi:hypothetical protein
MLDEYLKKLDDFILAADEIVDIEILRRSIWDTELEKIAIYRYRIHFYDGSLVELTERLVEEKGELRRTKYRYHWQTKDGALIKRWDNAKHHPGISTFPHHLHDGEEENVVSHKEPEGLEILSLVIEEFTRISHH